MTDHFIKLVHIRALHSQIIKSRGLSVLRCPVAHAEPVYVLVVQVRFVLQKQLDDRNTSLHGGPVQRGLLLGVLVVGVRTLLQEVFDQFFIWRPRSPHEARVSVRLADCVRRRPKLFNHNQRQLVLVFGDGLYKHHVRVTLHHILLHFDLEAKLEQVLWIVNLFHLLKEHKTQKKGQSQSRALISQRMWLEFGHTLVMSWLKRAAALEPLS